MGVKTGDITAKPTDDVLVYEEFDENMYKLAKNEVKPDVTRKKREEMTRELVRAALGEETAYKECFTPFVGRIGSKIIAQPIVRFVGSATIGGSGIARFVMPVHMELLFHVRAVGGNLPVITMRRNIGRG